MNLHSMRRRLEALEIEAPSTIRYPPLTREEIDDLLQRSADRKPWTTTETERVRQQCPIVQGECFVYLGKKDIVTIRRYGGINIEELQARDRQHLVRPPD